MSVLEDMVTAARAVREKAYAPYSRFKVGACLRTDTGQLVVGANVENAAYPQGQCAEASAIGNMIANGSGDKVVEVVVMGGGDALCTPCGGCLQRLNEFATEATPVHVCGTEGVRETFTLGELLPGAFGPHNLD